MSPLRHGVGASGVQSSGIRLSVGNERLETLINERLETLINDNADFHEAFTDYADRHAPQDEITDAFRSGPANLAVAEPESVNPTGLCSLIVTLLSGHGLKPVPRLAAGWVALIDDATPQSTWHETADALGLSGRQALSVAIAKLVLWHWSQPVAYLVVLRVYYCDLDPQQVAFAQVVAAREVLYLSTTIVGILLCPSYLLLDIATVWNEAKATTTKLLRVAVYVLTPHNYVALCLANHFSVRHRPLVQPFHFKKIVGLACITTVYAVPIGYACVMAWQTHNSFGTCMLDPSCFKGGNQSSWHPLSPICESLMASYSANHTVCSAAVRSNLTDAMCSERDIDVYCGPSLFQVVGILSWFIFMVPLLVIGVVLQRHIRPHVTSEHGPSIENADTRVENGERVQGAKGALASGFFALAATQLFADVCSCFALGKLLQQATSENYAFDPTALIWGYGITAFGFVLVRLARRHNVDYLCCACLRSSLAKNLPMPSNEL